MKKHKFQELFDLEKEAKEIAWNYEGNDISALADEIVAFGRRIEENTRLDEINRKKKKHEEKP